MAEQRWVELRNLPEEVRTDDRDAVRKWLVEWGAKRGREAVVWIDLRTCPEQVRAGTSIQTDKIIVPEELLARFNDEAEKLEVSYNHSEVEGQGGLVARDTLMYESTSRNSHF